MSLTRAFFAVCKANPTKVAIRTSTSEPMTYSALQRAVENLASALPKGNVPIAITGPNPADTTVATLASWLNGAMAVPLCISHTPPERQYSLEDCTAAVVVNGREVADVFPRLSSTLATSPGDALMIYTSGTTGKPKGVVHTHDSVSSQINMLRKAWQWSSCDVALNHLPLHHVHGLVNITLCALFSGATVEFRDFEKTATMQYLGSADCDINVLMSVPTVYSKLCEAFGGLSPEAQHQWTRVFSERMRLVVSGSAALPPPLKTEFEKISGVSILERYGMTEAGMILSQDYANIASRVAGTVGVPLPGVVVKTGESGELTIQSPSLFRTYWNRPAEVTAKEFTEDGYFKTGDTVTVDANTGAYRIQGRTSVDIVKVSGYKISTLEIEAVVLSMGPALVQECVAFGVPDPTYGDSIVLVVVSNNATQVSIASYCEKNLVKYKQPRKIVVTSEPLPRNAMGKISKKELAKLTW